MKMNNKRRGFTLIELFLSIIIMVIIMLVVINAFKLTVTSQVAAKTEFTYQNEVRAAINLLNKHIESTKAVFLMNHDDFYDKKAAQKDGRPKKLKAKWDYYAIVNDTTVDASTGKAVVTASKLVYFEYDRLHTTNESNPVHKQKVLVEVKDKELKLDFVKQFLLTELDKRRKNPDGTYKIPPEYLSDAEQADLIRGRMLAYQNGDRRERDFQDANHFVKFGIAIHDKDDDLLRDIKTEVEAKAAIIVANARQILNNADNPVDVIAVRNRGIDNNVLVYISLIIDNSISMRGDIALTMNYLSRANYDARFTNGFLPDLVNGIRYPSPYVSRFDMLKDVFNGRAAEIDAAGNLIREQSVGFLAEMGKYGNVFATIIPYNRTANYPAPLEHNPTLQLPHPLYSLSDGAELHQAQAEIDRIDIGMEDSNGTNTGDGIRRAFYYHHNLLSAVEENYSRRLMRTYSASDANHKAHEAIAQLKQVLEYTIVLTDGDANYFSVTTNGYYYGDGAVGSPSPEAGANFNRTINFDWDRNVFDGIFQPDVYAEEMGRRLVNNATVEGVDAFVIAFSSRSADKHSSERLANAMGAEYFDYGVTHSNLDDIFSDIKDRINSDLEILQGPY